LSWEPPNFPPLPSFPSPVGLFAFFLTGEQGVKFFVAGGMGIFPGLAGWVVYALLFLCMCRVKRTLTLFVLYAVLSVLLALNTSGCNKILHAAAEIH
jgi:hypothetical protein